MPTSYSQCSAKEQMQVEHLLAAELPLLAPSTAHIAQLPLPYASATVRLGTSPPLELALLAGAIVLVAFARTGLRRVPVLHGMVALVLIGIIGISVSVGVLTLASLYCARAAVAGEFQDALRVAPLLQSPWIAWPVRAGIISSWAKAGTLSKLHEHVVAGAIRQALQDRSPAISSLAQIYAEGSAEGDTLRAYALVVDARLAFSRGDVDAAARYAQLAFGMASHSAFVTATFRTMQIWQANALAERGDIQALQRQVLVWDADDRAMRTDLRQRLFATAAKMRFISFANADDSDAASAIEVMAELDAMLDLARQFGEEDSHSTHCLIHTIHQAQASRLYMSGEAEMAVRELENALSHVPDSPDAAGFMPFALHAAAIARLQQDDGIGAEEFLGRLLQLNPDAVADIRPTMVSALILASRQYAERRNSAASIDAASRAHGLGSSPMTAGALGWAHVHSADEHRRRAEWSAAQTDYQDAGAYATLAGDVTLNQRAKMQEEDAQNFGARMAYIDSAPRWFVLPRIRGQLCIGMGHDGHCGQVELYGDSPERPVAVLDEGDPARPVVFYHRQAEGEVHAIKAVLPGGRPNLWEIAYPGSDTQLVWVDVNSDARPDAKFTYERGELKAQEALSGRVLVRVASAVVSAPDLELIGEPDVYFAVELNGASLGRSNAVRNTRFPAFEAGVALEFHYGDSLVLHLFDEDFWSPDDAIGSVRLSSEVLPKSGIYKTDTDSSAIHLISYPTHLPAGRYVVEGVGNVFQQSPEQVSEVSALIAKALHQQQSEFWIREIARLGLAELSVAALLPQADILTNLVAFMAADNVLEATL